MMCFYSRLFHAEILFGKPEAGAAAPAGNFSIKELLKAAYFDEEDDGEARN